MSIEYICEETIDIENGVYRHDKHERIVRCRDCKHKEAGLEPPFYCLRLGAYKEFSVSLDGFCAWGKRRETDGD